MAGEAAQGTHRPSYLLESMEKDGTRRYHSPAPTAQDPPDCVAHDAGGNLVGFELTELVSERAIRENQKGNKIYHNWGPREVIAATECLLRSKDSKQFHGGPYSGRVTLIFTDEITILFEEYQPVLSAHRFVNLPNTDEAYFLFSYNGVDRCPYVQLKVSKAS